MSALQDSPQNVVMFWRRGTASSFENTLIELFLLADEPNTRILAAAYPALYRALRAEGRRFLDAGEVS